MPIGRRMTNALASAAVGAIIGARVADAQSGYRAIRRSVIEAVEPPATGTSTRPSSSSPRRAPDSASPTCRWPRTTVRRAISGACAIRRASSARIWRHRAGARRSCILLCTNDDGILAYGLECLAKAASHARRRDRRGARPRAERHEPLAHAASSAAPGAARRAALPGGRHAHRLRDARGRGAHARAARLRAERHEPRPEHGRGRPVLGHRRGGHGRAGARHPAMAISFAGGDLQADPDVLGDQVAVLADLLRHLTGLTQIPARHAAEHQHAAAQGPGHQGRAPHAPRPPRVLGFAHAHEGPARPRDLLDRRRERELERAGGFRFPRRARRLHLRHAAHLDLTHLEMLDDPSTWWRAP